MKYLIINADDFGYSKSINLGIVEGINKGAITSTSLMVLQRYADQVSSMVDNQSISIGLHFELPDKGMDLEEEFKSQINKFYNLVGRKPDHLDTHKVLPKNVPGLKKIFDNYSKETKTPIRDWGYANFIDDFFGYNVDGTGELDIDRLTPDSLLKSLENNLQEGYNELMCHAAYVDEELISLSSYNEPREIELNTLLSNEFKKYLSDNKDQIKLVSWKDVNLNS